MPKSKMKIQVFVTDDDDHRAFLSYDTVATAGDFRILLGKKTFDISVSDNGKRIVLRMEGPAGKVIDISPHAANCISIG